MLGEVVSFPSQRSSSEYTMVICCDVVQKECWTNLCPLPRDPGPLRYLAGGKGQGVLYLGVK